MKNRDVAVADPEVSAHATRQDDPSAEPEAVRPRPEPGDYWIFFDGEFKRYKDVRLGLRTHALHYGTGCFDGIRAYWNQEQGQLYAVLPDAHYQRLTNSAKILGIALPYSVEQMVSATMEVLRRNEYREDVYIRALVFLSEESMGVRLHGLKSSLAIMTEPFGDYLNMDRGLRCTISSWRRVDDNAAPARAKVTGIYINSALAKTDAFKKGFDEAIVLTQDGHVSEGSAENLFMVKGKQLISPPATDNNLEGLTRYILSSLATEDLGLEFVQRSIDRSELYVADEVVLCGTGAQVASVTEIDDRTIGAGVPGPVGTALQSGYFDVVRGRVEQRMGWLKPVYATADGSGVIGIA